MLLDALIIWNFVTSNFSELDLSFGTNPVPNAHVLCPNNEFPSNANLDVPQPLS